VFTFFVLLHKSRPSTTTGPFTRQEHETCKSNNNRVLQKSPKTLQLTHHLAVTIMKTFIPTCAAIALFRSVIAALPQNNADKYHGQLVYQPARNEKLDLPVTTEYVEVPIAKPVMAAHGPYENKRPEELDYSDRSQISKEPTTPKEPAKDHAVPPPSAQWAIVYFPYNDDSTCKSLLSVRSDVAKIARKGFKSIRLHAIDCSALEKVGSAAAIHGLKLILGVHIDELGIEEARPQVDEIIVWAQGLWSGVEMIVIGEEAVFNDAVTATELATFIVCSKNKLRAAGYTGPVTTTEPVTVLAANADVLCPVLDIAAANIHPFFHPEVAAEDAGEYVRTSLNELASICVNVDEAVNLETGWPRRGQKNGDAKPGVMEQMVAMSGILREAGERSVVLGFGDDGWKDEGEMGVEGSWGCEGLFAEV